MKTRNKLLSSLLVMALWGSCFAPGALAAEPEEEESAYTRIEISSAAELMDFAQSCVLDTWSRDKEVVLTEDISLAGWDFEPIPSFGGRLRGHGHTISGLVIDSSAAPSGLFGETQESAEIRDLTVSGSVSPSGDGSTVGGIVGKNRGLLADCVFTGHVTGRSRTGGLVGLNTESGRVDHCRMNGGVTGRSMTGGIVGRNDGLILGCRNEGYINIESADPSLNLEGLSLSGLLTAAEDGSLAVVNVSTDTGGVCGYSAGEITDCVNNGAVGYPHIGYNVGGIVGRNAGYLNACRNYGPINGRRDIGGIAGQMEPFVELVLTEDMAQKLQQQMNGLSYLLNETVEDAHSTSDTAASRLDQIAASLRPVVDAAVGSEDPAQIAQQLGSLIGSMAGISGQLNGVAAGMRQSAETLVEDMQRVIRQLNAVNTTLSLAIDAAGTIDSTDVLSDTSQENVDAVTVGKALDCRNSGAVSGDINVGGIAGSMSVEVEMDPEGDSARSVSSLLHREYQMKSILQHCTNLGTVTARKNCAGSVCGQMDLGLIFGCFGYGSAESESGDYVGGIVGLTQGVVRACWAKCTLRGGSFIGGIAGSGARSESTGTSSMIAECRSMVSIDRAAQYTGAIAGGEDGDFADNLFVSDSLAGINRLNRSGQAEPVPYRELLEQEDTPTAFRNLTLEFRIDGERVLSRIFPYGASFSDDIFPSLPEREGCYGTWDTTELRDLSFDTVVNAVYLPSVTALRSAEVRLDGKPVFLVEGAFREEDSLTARQTETDDLQSIIGEEQSVLLTGLRGDLSRGRAVSEQWALSFPSDGADSHVVRYLAAEGGTAGTDIYLKTENGWQKALCGTFGSYLTFPVSGTTAEIAAVHTGVAWWVIVLYALGAAAMLYALGALLRAVGKKRGTKPSDSAPETAPPPERSAHRPRLRIRNKKVLWMAVIALTVIALGVVFLRSGARNGLELLRMADALSREENVNLTMNASLDLGDNQFETTVQGYKTRVSDTDVLCLRHSGASLFYANGCIYLENGAAFRVEPLLPGRWDALKAVLSLRRVLDIRSQREGDRKIYRIDAKMEDPGPLLELLFPTVAARLSRVESFHADIITVGGRPESAALTASGVLEGGTALSLRAEVALEAPDPLNNTVPPAVKAAMKAPAGESARAISSDFVRMLYGWAELTTRDPMAADIRLRVNCGSLIVNDDLRYTRGSAGGSILHRVEDAGVALYYANGRLCTREGKVLSLGQSNAESSARLLELCYQGCMNGSFSCRETEDGSTYTVTLRQEDLGALMAAIAPESQALSITPQLGSITLQMENDRIRSLSVSCSGTLSVALLKADAAFDAEITVDDTPGEFTVPEAVIRALTE